MWYLFHGHDFLMNSSIWESKPFLRKDKFSRNQLFISCYFVSDSSTISEKVTSSFNGSQCIPLSGSL